MIATARDDPTVVDLVKRARAARLDRPTSGYCGQDHSVRAAPVDEVGWFVFRRPPSGMCRLHVRTTEGTTVRTEWARLQRHPRRSARFRWPRS